MDRTTPRSDDVELWKRELWEEQQPQKADRGKGKDEPGLTNTMILSRACSMEEREGELQWA
jgi:hypothetical protein